MTKLFKKQTLLNIALTLSLLGFSNSGFAKTQVVWWHAMENYLGQIVTELVTSFNASQDEYEIVEISKGSYGETIQKSIEAFKNGKDYPHFIQVQEVGTRNMMNLTEMIYPLYDMVKDFGLDFDKNIYVPSVVSYYETEDGRLASVPFNASSPTFWYNKDAFARAGIKTVPKTWNEVAEAARILRANGMKCGFTNRFPIWILVENYSAFNNIPITTQNNGYSGKNPQLLINNKHMVSFWERLQKWSNEGLYSYTWPGGKTTSQRFTDQDCGMGLESSGEFATFNRKANFRFGQTMMPYDDQVVQKPQNSIIGGASLWVLRGHSKESYKGILEFFKFVSDAEVQAIWHEKTGYVPTTKASYTITKNMRFYAKRVGTDSAYKELNLNPPTVNSKGLRIGEHQKVRDAIQKELEAMLKNEKTAQEALDTAVKNGNKILQDFYNRTK